MGKELSIIPVEKYSVMNVAPCLFIYYDKPRRYTLAISLIEGDGNTTSLVELKLEPVVL